MTNTRNFLLLALLALSLCWTASAAARGISELAPRAWTLRHQPILPTRLPASTPTNVSTCAPSCSTTVRPAPRSSEPIRAGSSKASGERLRSRSPPS